LRAFFVRKTANHEVVGLFVAPTVLLLAALVDECCDPNACEYALARTGGIIVSASTDATWPLSDTASDGSFEFATGLEAAVLTQQWGDDLRFVGDSLSWKPLAPAAKRLTSDFKRSQNR
jgi:hypothetical protein